MAANEIHQNDIGTVFQITVKDGDNTIDVSGATTKNFLFQKPDGTDVSKAASFVTDGTDGQLKYTTVTDDLDTVGTWYLQVELVLPAGTWRSDITKFRVYNNLV